MLSLVRSAALVLSCFYFSQTDRKLVLVMSPAATKDLFRKTWGCFPTGVTIITFYEEDGTVHGLTANSVCSVSLEPMLVMVCVDHKARSFPILRKSERFVMNFLARGQQESSTYFARSDTDGEPPFAFTKSEHGYPVLEGNIAYMDCKVYKTVEAGDHTLFIGEVEEMELTDGDALVFSHGKYTSVVDTGA